MYPRLVRLSSRLSEQVCHFHNELKAGKHSVSNLPISLAKQMVSPAQTLYWIPWNKCGALVSESGPPPMRCFPFTFNTSVNPNKPSETFLTPLTPTSKPILPKETTQVTKNPGFKQPPPQPTQLPVLEPGSKNFNTRSGIPLLPGSFDETPWMLNLQVMTGIQTITLTNMATPGMMVTFDFNAIPLIPTLMVGGGYAPLFALGALGLGRIMGGASKDLFTPQAPTPPSNNNQLILNSFAWAAQCHPSLQVALISHKSNEDQLIQLLATGQKQATLITWPETSASPPSVTFTSHSVIYISKEVKSHMVPFLLDYVSKGAGLIMMQSGWEVYPSLEGHFGVNYPPNMISIQAGFLWSFRKAMQDPTSPNSTPSVPFNYLNFHQILNLFYAIWTEGKVSSSLALPHMALLTQYSLEVIPLSAPNTFYNVYKSLADFLPKRLPTPKSPIEDPTLKVEMDLFHLCTDYVLDPVDVPVHPAHLRFPGKVANLQDLRFKPGQSVTINIANYYKMNNTLGHTRRREWLSTGLYAAPGYTVAVSITSPTGNFQNFSVAIGCHPRHQEILSKWARLPSLRVSRYLHDPITYIASPYGGLVYIETTFAPVDGSVIGGTAGQGVNQIQVKFFSGVQLAPHYILGKTTNAQWNKIHRYRPGIWGELEGANVVLSAPTRVRNALGRLKGAEVELIVMLWDDVLNAYADFRGLSRQRTQKERLVPDMFNHSTSLTSAFIPGGYPALINGLVNVNNFADIHFLLREGSYECFHSLAMNEVHPNMAAWDSPTKKIFAGILVFYALNAVLNICFENLQNPTAPLLTSPQITAMLNAYIQGGKNINQWQQQELLGILTFLQLKEIYGWAALQKVFVVFQNPAGNGEQIPATAEAKMESAFVVIAKHIQVNLIEFLESWGFSLSAGAKSVMQGFSNASMIRITDWIERTDRTPGTTCDQDSFGQYVIKKHSKSYVPLPNP